MKAQHKVYIVLLIFALMPIVNYLTFFGPQTHKDEVILVISLAVIGSLYAFFFRKIIAHEVGLSTLKEKAFESEFFSERLQTEKDEIKLIHNFIVSLTSSIQKAEAFIENIKSGKLHSESEKAEKQQEENVLIHSLEGLRSQLLDLEKEEKERNWVAEGMAKFVEILRNNAEGSSQFYENIITNIVKYLNANQGSLFLVGEKNGQKVLSMEACYAYNRKKFISKEIQPGEGLVGQTYLEKETTYLKEVPENYISITSGLGEAPPRNLLVVPFKLNEEVQCIIEIASFHIIAPYQIAFLERLGESIASSISSLRINEHTKKLLEETQSQTEALRAQEEEMRQNMEELQATQESLERESKEKEHVQKEVQKNMDFMQAIINALPDPVFVKDRNHNVIIVNEAFCKLNKVKATDIIGKNDFDLFPKEEAEVFFAAEEKLFEERSSSLEEEKASRDGETTYRITQKRIIENDDSALFLVGMNHDITSIKEIEEALNQEKYLLDALMHNATDSIYFKDKESKFIRVSNNMLERLNAKQQEEIMGKSDFDFFTEEHAMPAFEGEQRIIATGEPILNLVEKETWEDGSVTYVSTTKVPLKDLDGVVIGTFGISRDVTETKLIEMEMERQGKLISSLFNYSDEILLIADSKENLNFVSANIKNILGIDEEKIHGHSIKTLVHKEDAKGLDQALKNAKKENPVTVALRLAIKPGSYVSVEACVYNALEDVNVNGFVFKVKALEESMTV